MLRVDPNEVERGEEYVACDQCAGPVTSGPSEEGPVFCSSRCEMKWLVSVDWKEIMGE